MNHIEESIRNRRSVRTYDGREISKEIIETLKAFIKTIRNPYEIPVEFEFLSEKETGLDCYVVSGTDCYVGGKIRDIPHANEAFGYSFEMLVLYAKSLGIGTVWLGGMMNRSAYELAMRLAKDEMVPCAIALGYSAAKMSDKERTMRKRLKADERQPFEELFFERSFDTPLMKERAGRFSYPLEMVRLAPSAINMQPWRIVVCDNVAHFYLRRSDKFSPGAIDIQKVDIGIALCHFELASREKGMDVTLVVDDPEILVEAGTEYIASYQLREN